MELTCAQDQQTGQTAVQQFHVPISLALPPSSECQVVGSVAETTIVSVETECDVDGLESALSADMLSLMDLNDENAASPDVAGGNLSHSKSSLQTESPRGEVSGGSAGISFISKDPTSLPVGAFPEFARVSDASGNSSTTIPNSSLPSDSVDIGVKSKHILLNALKVKQSVGPDNAPAVAAVRSQRGPAPKPCTPEGTDTSLASPNTTHGAGSDLRTVTLASTFSDAAKNIAEQKDVAPSMSAAVVQEPPEGAASTGADDDWEKASLTISRSQHNTPQQSRAKEVVVDVATISILLEKVNALEQAVQTMSERRLDEPKAGVSKDVLKGINKQVVASLNGMVEEQSQQITSQILKSRDWREQLSARISADIRKELEIFMSQAMKDAAKDCIKDNMLPALAKSFREGFNETLVPAYQSATGTMFNQMQQIFESAVSDIVSDFNMMKRNSEEENRLIREELGQLRTEVAFLKTQNMGLLDMYRETVDAQTATIVNALSQSGNSQFLSGVACRSNGKAVDYETSYITLYEEGRISESLEVALEEKDVNCVLWVLNQQQSSNGSIAGLIDKCAEPVLLLCTASQLAVDLSHNEPVEGLALRLEWLKEIVVWLMNSVDELRAAIVPQSGRSLEAVVKSILMAMKETEFRHAPTLAVSSARKTDLRMLCSILTTSFS